MKDLKLNKLGLPHLLLLVAAFALLYGFNNYNNNKFNNFEPMAPVNEEHDLDGLIDNNDNGDGNGNVEPSLEGNNSDGLTDVNENSVLSAEGNAAVEDAKGLMPKNNLTPQYFDAEAKITTPEYNNKGRNKMTGPYQLMGDFVIPKKNVCPWNVSTIEPVKQRSIAVSDNCQ